MAKDLSNRNNPPSALVLDPVPPGVSELAVVSFRLARAIKADVRRLLAQDDPIGLVSWRVLVGLTTAPNSTQTDLVDFTKTEQAQLSRTLKDMQQNGLITSKPCPSDKRTKLFSLTPLGRRRYGEKLPGVKQLVDCIDSALSDDEKPLFLEMCQRIAAASQQSAEDHHQGEASKLELA